jgi:1-acyl-sn-glycerol-3-phosphate acyltransferase
MCSLRRECGLVDSMARWAWWSAIRGYFAAGHRLSIRGRTHLPAEPPFVLVANHASHLDALALAAALPWRLWDRVFPIAAGDTFFRTPMLAAFAAGLLNALPMWRHRCGSHALGELRSRLVDGKCVYVLFPEGTRTRDGRMGSFKPGVGRLVAGTDVPVVPCHLRGTFNALPPGATRPRLERIRVRMGEPLRFDAHGDDRAGWTTIARETETAVRKIGHEPLRTADVDS